MISEIKKEDFRKLARYLDEGMEHPRLRNLFLELTDSCNLCCAHCGSGCSAANGTFLETAAVMRTLREVADRCDPSDVRICITGGEPMLHPDLCAIIRRAKELGFTVGLTTNGTLIDEAAARRLTGAGLDSVAISLDGLPQSHDRFRNSGGSWQAAVEGIRNLKGCGLEPQVTTVVHRGNLGELDGIYRLLKALEVWSWAVIGVDPIGRAREKDDLLLTGPELEQMYTFIRDKRFDPENDMEVTAACSHFQGLDFEHETRDFYFQCWAGTRNASITASGDIVACLDIERRPELVQGSIYTGSFMEAWESGFQVFRRNRALESRTCAGCEHAAQCRGDSAHTWDYDRNEPRYCVKTVSN